MNNVILIGMPASGKTTAGRELAKKLGYAFLDGDDLIRAREGRPLGALIAERGAEGFLQIEEETLCSIPSGTERTVIATGGSAVYSAKAMAWLKTLGTTVYLALGEEEIKRRIPDFNARGVVMRGKISTAEELAAERVPLYEKYADFTLSADGKSAETVAREAAEALNKR